jgi:hypothetical protein
MATATAFTLSFYLGGEYRLKSIAGEEHTLKYRLLSDFTSNAKYLAFYFPAELVDARLFFTLLDEHAKFLAAPETNVTLGRYGPVGLQAEVDTSAKSGAKLGILWPGDLRHLKEDDLPFTGRIYFYSENDAPPDVLEKLYEYAEAKGYR